LFFLLVSSCLILLLSGADKLVSELTRGGLGGKGVEMVTDLLRVEGDTRIAVPVFVVWVKVTNCIVLVLALALALALSFNLFWTSF
jgi:hypothetical protein